VPASRPSAVATSTEIVFVLALARLTVKVKAWRLWPSAWVISLMEIAPSSFLYHADSLAVADGRIRGARSGSRGGFVRSLAASPATGTFTSG